MSSFCKMRMMRMIRNCMKILPIIFLGILVLICIKRLRNIILNISDEQSEKFFLEGEKIIYSAFQWITELSKVVTPQSGLGEFIGPLVLIAFILQLIGGICFMSLFALIEICDYVLFSLMGQFTSGFVFSFLLLILFRSRLLMWWKKWSILSPTELAITRDILKENFQSVTTSKDLNQLISQYCHDE